MDDPKLNMGGLLGLLGAGGWGALLPNTPPGNFSGWGPPLAVDDCCRGAEKLNVGADVVAVAPNIPPGCGAG